MKVAIWCLLPWMSKLILRLARDLQWVSRQKYPHLAEQLKAGSSSVAAVARPSGNIVQFRCVEPTDPGAEAYEVA